MKYTVNITNLVTRETVKRRCDWDWEEGERFNWEMGNFECDCNRALEFLRAKGQEPDVMNEGTPCNTSAADRRYRVDSIVLDDGTVVYEEKDPRRN